MADEKVIVAQAVAGGTSTFKTIAIVATVMLVEGAAFLGTMYFSGGPSEAAAGQEVDSLVAEMNKTAEVMVLKERFYNEQSGRAYYYSTEIFVTTKKKHEEEVAAKIKASEAQIVTRVNEIFQKAEHSLFRELGHATLTRQVKAMLDERFGKDADDQPILDEVLIKRCFPMRADI